MRDKFDYFGIKKPERELIFKNFLIEKGDPPDDQLESIIKELWQHPCRECQYTAVGIMERFLKSGKLINNSFEETIQLLEYLITTKSWWDTVDSIAVRMVGFLLRREPQHIKEYVKKWINSNKIWLQRTVILFQLQYKEDTDKKLLFNTIKQFTGSGEFFIQKAIGWALREYSKTAPKQVIEFVNKTALAPLSKREAFKVIKKSKFL
jgi:3-methyladenine DNA glycosylase AlkD